VAIACANEALVPDGAARPRPARFLLDTSVWVRLDARPVAERCLPLIRRGLAATCSIVDLAVLYSARTPAGYGATRADRALALEQLAVEQPVLDRAVEVQAALAERGEHRGASLADLIIAATAERANVTVLHYDADYDLIASVTGQQVDWVVPRGSL
jgi:predicted nucleic acid-binding protein